MWEIGKTTRRAVLLACLAVTGCATAKPAPGGATVYVVARGWHTDIGLPAAPVTGPLAVLRARFPGVRTLLFGFGDRAYLTSGKHDTATALRALLPGPGAMLITALRTTPDQAFGASNVVTLSPSQDGADRLARFIWNSLDHSGTDGLSSIGDGPYPGSLFLTASTLYSGLFTCNTWTARGLHAAGLPILWPGVLFASQVMTQARRAAP